VPTKTLPRLGLTPRQNACLAAIRAHRDEEGTMPSLSELQTRLQLASRSGVHRLLTQLEMRGAIRRASGRARAIQIATATCPHCGGDVR
jgi:repressor LexA